MYKIPSALFWKSWPKVYRYIGAIIALLFIACLLFFWYTYWNYPPLSWDHIQELNKKDIPVHTFEQGLLELTTYGNNYVVFEHLLGKSISINSTAAYIFLGALLLFMTVWISITTLLKRLWYYIGMGLFIFFMVSLHLEVFGIFGMDTKLFVALVLVVYAAISFYFQFFGNATSFLARCLTFFLITVVLVGVLMQFSNVDKPLLHLVANGLLAASVISIVFIFTVAHEIIASFVYVVSQSAHQRKSLNHFLFISVIYMANLALAYVHRIGMITWDFTYINLFLLLTVSGILGIWGVRNREAQYKNILPADPFAVYLTLCMAIVCFSTIGYFLATANDAPLVAMGDAILYAHIGYGLMFLLYVLSNFIAMMANNIPVHNVLYQPNRMPYFTFRFAGIIATLAFVFANTWQMPVNNLLSASYQAEGDIYRSSDNLGVAEAFYRKAGTYGFLNHRSNYAIAQLKGRQYSFYEERNFYNRANRRRPTAFSYLNLSQTYQRERDWLGAMLVLSRAREKFPNNGPIANTIGIVYSKLNVIDSALYFFSKAAENDQTKTMAMTNFIGMLVENKVSAHLDSLVQSINSDNTGAKGNAIALANIQDTALNVWMPPLKKPSLDVFDAVFINNYLINRIKGHQRYHMPAPDTAFVRSVVKLSTYPENASFRELLSFTCALALYESGQVWDAIDLLEETTAISVRQGRYNNVLALWAIEQSDPQGALIFLDYSNNQHYEEAKVSLAVALAESGRISESLERWKILRDEDSTYHVLAKKMIRILTISPHQIASLTDEEKYIYCHYRVSLFDNDLFDRILLTIENNDLVAKAIFERSQKFFERDQTDVAAHMLRRINGIDMRDHSLYERITFLEMAIMAKQKKFSMLAKRVEEIKNKYGGNLPLTSEQLYYGALLSERSGDTAKADAQYRLLAKYNPYDEEAIMASVYHLGKHDEGGFAAYNVLVDALHYNPYSVKLLKAYTIEAYRMGLNEYADDTLQRLEQLLTQQEMSIFLQKNRKVRSSAQQ